MNSTTSTLLFILGGFSIAQAQEMTSLSQQQAIALGLKNNLEIQMAILKTNKSKALTKSAWEIPKTEVKGSFGQLNSLDTDKNFEINQSFNPFEIGAKKKVLQLNNQVSEVDLAKAKQIVIFNIRQLWNTLLFYQSQTKVLQEQNEILLKFSNAANKRYDAGETNALEKNIAVVKQLELEQNINSNQTLIAIEKSKLSNFMQLETDFSTLETKLIPLKSDLQALSIDKNLALQESAIQINLAKAEHKLEKSALYPELSVGYFMQSMVGATDDNSSKVFGNELDFKGFTIGVALPIFAGSSISKAKAAKIQIEVEEKNNDFIKSQIKYQLEQELKQLEQARLLMEFYNTIALPNADEINSNADKSFKNGAISYVEFVKSIETAYEIHLKANEAISNYNKIVINLHYLTNN